MNGYVVVVDIRVFQAHDLMSWDVVIKFILVLMCKGQMRNI